MENNQLSNLLGLIETRQWDTAWQEFERLLEEGPPTARLLLMGSHAAFGRRDYFKARHFAERALATWSSSDPAKLLGQIRFHLGMVTRKIGDTHVAVEQFQLFLSELSSKYPELIMGEGNAYFYLALTLRERRDYDGSVSSYQNAIGSFRRDGLPSLLCAALQNYAWLLCHMGRLSEAADCLAESADLVRSQEDQVHQALGEAFLSTLEGKHAQAATLCTALFQRIERGEALTAEEKSQAAWVAGMAACAQDNLEGAAALADVALSFATEAKDSRLMNDASTLRRSVHIRRQAGA